LFNRSITEAPSKCFQPAKVANKNVLRKLFGEILDYLLNFCIFIGRMAKVNVENYVNCKFSDVEPVSYYAPYVEWARQQGVVQGVGDNLFSPDAVATREQLAVIVSNYVKTQNGKLTPVNAAVTFTDQSGISSWASDAVSTLQRAGVLSGYPDGAFRPQNPVTREEACKILCEGLLY
jgi:hypothetical protein